MLLVCDDQVEVKRHKEALKLETTRTNVAVSGKSIKMNESALLRQVMRVRLYGFWNLRVLIPARLGARIEADQRMKAAFAILIRFHNVLRNGGSQRRAIGVNKHEMCPAFTIRIIDTPNPPAFMGEQLDVRIEGKVIVS